MIHLNVILFIMKKEAGGQSPSLSIIFLDCRARCQWLSGLYYAVQYFSCGDFGTGDQFNELPISIPLFCHFFPKKGMSDQALIIQSI